MSHEANTPPQNATQNAPFNVTLGPILPPGTIGGHALGIVTASMCFLACLALGAALLVNSAADRWLAQAASAVTVQIIESGNQTAQDQLPVVQKILARTPGIASAQVIERDDVVRLLEPWLGAGNVTDELPLPILLDIQLDPQTPVNQRNLKIELKAVAPGASFDTHGHWQESLAQGAFVLRMLAGFILLLVLTATATVLIFATRAALTANREILEVLNLIGATDHFISRQLTRHLARLSLLSSIIGMGLAMGLFYFSQNLLPIMPPPELFLGLVAVAALITFFSWFVTYHYVMRILNVSP